MENGHGEYNILIFTKHKQIFKFDFSDQAAATSVGNTSATEGIFK